MIANCTRCCGRHSTVAPESRSTAGARSVGMIVASAARSTPGSLRTPRAPPSPLLPCPALKSAAARPSRTASAATRIDACGAWWRSAAAAGSAISMRSGASAISRRPILPPHAATAPARWRGARPRAAARFADAGPPSAPGDDGLRCVIAAHRVDRDTHVVGAGGWQLSAGTSAFSETFSSQSGDGDPKGFCRYDG